MVADHSVLSEDCVTAQHAPTMADHSVGHGAAGSGAFFRRQKSCFVPNCLRACQLPSLTKQPTRPAPRQTSVVSAPAKPA